ncbi:hypothetical protein [Pseudomonas serbica]|uniref:hypothetical protein n=1 Tax=Pseudomonas serbica TaxID=2965074 RepID=UPI00237AAD4E|nr:hypothetical protein [Pseudomonas serbica]
MTSRLQHELPKLHETNEVLSWIRQVSGADLVFPGHPVVIACSIMALYSDIAQVTAPATEVGSAEAMADGRVPGAGDCVRAALHALTSGASVGEMLETMRRYWSRSQAGGHMGNVDPGIAQALKLEPYFRENVENWLGRVTTPLPTAAQTGGVRNSADQLPDDLEALVNELAIAVRSARLMSADLAISEVRELCHLINLEDEAGRPRALQTPAIMLYGVIKGFGICGLISNRQIVDFAPQIFTQSKPDQYKN